MFTKELIQSVSDWQRGEGSSKADLAQALKLEALKLPPEFRSTTGKCYRRIDVDPEHLMMIGTQLKLPETISSWTKSYQVACNHKDGPPRAGYQALIFEIESTGDVILDLDKLFSDKSFRRKIHEIQGQIKGYREGIKLYANIEKEVVIERAEVSFDSLHACGGYSKDKSQYAKMLYGPNPTEAQLKQFDQALVKGKLKTGPQWLNDREVVDRLSKKLRDNAAKLSNPTK